VSDLCNLHLPALALAPPLPSLFLHSTDHRVEQPNAIAGGSLTLLGWRGHIDVEPFPASSDEGVDVVSNELSSTGGLSVRATGHTVLHVSHRRGELRGEEFRTVWQLERRVREDRIRGGGGLTG
jgi:hypothetical protein